MTRELNLIIEQLMELLDAIIVFCFPYFCLMGIFLVFLLLIIRNYNLPPVEGQVPGLIQIPIKICFFLFTISIQSQGNR